MTTLQDLHIDPERFRQLAELARDEDLGRAGDITARLLAHAAQPTAAHIVCRQDAVVSGLAVLPHLLEVFPHGPDFEACGVEDGSRVAAGAAIGRLRGPLQSILSCQRTVLNFLQRLSGVASLTARYVAAIAGSSARIYDTRKTLPGWRDLDKYAVRCGGGHNHRRGLHDAVLIKDNHLAGVESARLAGHLFDMLNALEGTRPDFVEVEVDSLEQLEEVFKVVGVNVVLLDNFGPAALHQAVERRNALGLAGKIDLEASGGVELDGLRAVAASGVERVAIGALTHSAVAVDIGLDM